MPFPKHPIACALRLAVLCSESSLVEGARVGMHGRACMRRIHRSFCPSPPITATSLACACTRTRDNYRCDPILEEYVH